MMKHKKVILGAVVLSAVLLTLMIGGTLAYFTVYDSVDNNLTIGNVNIVLTEPEFPEEPESRIIVPFSTIPKDPQVTNVGKNNAFVFIRLTVPKGEIEPVNDDGSLKYPDSVTFTDGVRSSRTEIAELFRLVSDAPVSGRAALTEPAGIDADTAQLYDSDWYLLPNIDYDENLYLIAKTESVSENTYVFAYNKALPSASNAASPTDTQSTPIFNGVKLAYFVEDETMYQSPDTISVNAYAIQSDDLLDSGDLVTADLNQNAPEVWQLKRIFEYFSNQTGV